MYQIKNMQVTTRCMRRRTPPAWHRQVAPLASELPPWATGDPGLVLVKSVSGLSPSFTSKVHSLSLGMSVHFFYSIVCCFTPLVEITELFVECTFPDLYLSISLWHCLIYSSTLRRPCKLRLDLKA